MYAYTYILSAAAPLVAQFTRLRRKKKTAHKMLVVLSTLVRLWRKENKNYFRPAAKLFCGSAPDDRWTQAGLSQMFTSRKDLPSTPWPKQNRVNPV